MNELHAYRESRTALEEQVRLLQTDNARLQTENVMLQTTVAELKRARSSRWFFVIRMVLLGAVIIGFFLLRVLP